MDDYRLQAQYDLESSPVGCQLSCCIHCQNPHSSLYCIMKNTLINRNCFFLKFFQLKYLRQSCLLEKYAWINVFVERSSAPGGNQKAAWKMSPSNWIWRLSFISLIWSSPSKPFVPQLCWLSALTTSARPGRCVTNFLPPINYIIINYYIILKFLHYNN